ncbi:MAG: hypothetical protein COS11_06755 [bacterium (Candidatus Ratteibacteria) CG01_land_8_20_14_3_00_40_19]|uniref:Plasmid pRiA4b Orf3-like domain-containing protein n=2 Tax=Candidatus Ratteibacteria TaxID=2979319 RepID=A0A2M7E757_9BACT|nr:MAG: hypothetical protein COS11_06755 [bacterium (Candidatus Ratteibacteria) CG01_land_8_20_14_3_00_40_19]PIW34152.1 MAG: hypothetical protein COW28_00695 [bacterium (Candidatus Ratteibacteria) CG15_BIG_FIL_POST_REV_8_21_14_020_41_12]
MKKKFDRVYQFKITLMDVRLSIWRRIQVPETYSFWDLHVAIQDAMHWLDYHLHEFEIVNPSTGIKTSVGIPGDEDFGKEILLEWKQKIADYFSMENRLAKYTYDFGDNWEHIIKLEKVLPRDKNINYPVCIGGKRASPPEDCGGVWGYEDFLKIINNPDHEEYEETIEWAGGEFDPEYFDVKEIKFDDPAKRRKIAFES